LQEHEYYCVSCDGIVKGNDLRHDGTPRQPGLIHCSNCLGYYSNERQQSWHKNERQIWTIIDQEENEQYYANWDAYRASQGLGPLPRRS
jgi:hypothetical protein